MVDPKICSACSEFNTMRKLGTKKDWEVFMVSDRCAKFFCNFFCTVMKGTTWPRRCISVDVQEEESRHDFVPAKWGTHIQGGKG